jgi:eukaryotic-like serine/threonine-protein kinase
LTVAAAKGTLSAVFSAGQIVGNYQILSKLGTGGMGAVYLAEHPLIGKKVALKVIHRELAGNREVVQRFFQEARAVNTIGHENIVEIHDFGQTGEGDHFYIMEFLDGPTLAKVISRAGRLEVVRALHIAAQLANGLAAAHACGVIHRDLKPDNIMLLARPGNSDFVKILDFGLAKMFASGNSPLTALGVVLGTPQYMSPEACESKRDVDHRTDVYAVGVLLFQMLTGSLPFDGVSMGEVLVKQVTQLPPAPRGFNPEIPPSVEQIVLRCLAKAPAGRFPTMSALREALLSPESYLSSSPPMAAARSLVPGEAPNAKTMMAYVATRAGTSDPNPRPGSEDGGLGSAKTLAVQSLAMSPTAPQAAMSGAQVRAGASEARTMLAVGVSPAALAAGGHGGHGGHPGGAAPATGAIAAPPTVTIENRTMIIATPVGYLSAPPRRRWPMITAAAAISLIVGTVMLVLARDLGDAGVATTTPDAIAKIADAVAPSDAATRATDARVQTLAFDSGPIVVDGGGAEARAPARESEVRVETVPPGAAIWVAGQPRGVAPLTLRFDAATTRLTIEARKAGYVSKKETLVLQGKMSVQFNLRKAQRPQRPTGPANDLMRP